MPGEGSVTHWLHLLPRGDAEAAQRLWQAYFRRLVGLARIKLSGSPLRGSDEEDVVLSAFDSFFRGVEQGRFPQLKDRDNLWSLLVTITARKAMRCQRDENRLKRGGDVEINTGDIAAIELESVVGNEPTPEFAAQLAEECERSLNLLDNEELRSVALWKMEGFTNKEIAEKLPCSPRTVERKLELIRRIWEKKGVA